MSISGSDTLSLIDKEFGAAVIFILSSLGKAKYAKGCHFLDSRHHEAMTKKTAPKSFSTCILSMRERRMKKTPRYRCRMAHKTMLLRFSKGSKAMEELFCLGVRLLLLQPTLLSSRAKQWLVLCLTYNHRDISQLHGTNEVRERKTKRIEESTEKPPGKAKILNNLKVGIRLALK